jgi:dTDP-glucose pyrophosphorylase
MLDFAFHDAVRAGFDRAVLVIRREMQDAFEQGIAARWRDRLSISFAFQEMPAGRKPWGTVDALLSAAPLLTGSFAVVNADDYYGPAAYVELRAFLSERAIDTIDYAVVGFPIGETLSESGGVTRASLRTSVDRLLEHIEELFDVERIGEGIIARAADGAARPISASAVVSMNMWGFTPAVLPQMRRGFALFRETHGDDPRAELPIPTLIDSLVREGVARVRVLPGAGPWCGVTHPADRETVANFLSALVTRGTYPNPVWG